MIYDIVPPAIAAQRHQLNKLFRDLINRGGIVNGKACLMVYNAKAPEDSYITVELMHEEI